MRVSRLYLIPGIRERIAKSRFLFFTKTRGISSSQGNEFVNLMDYSFTHFESYFSIRERVDILVTYLANTARFSDKSRLLVIGPGTKLNYLAIGGWFQKEEHCCFGYFFIFRSDNSWQSS